MRRVQPALPTQSKSGNDPAHLQAQRDDVSQPSEPRFPYPRQAHAWCWYRSANQQLTYSRSVCAHQVQCGSLHPQMTIRALAFQKVFVDATLTPSPTGHRRGLFESLTSP